MRVVYLAAGAAGMYCGSCIRDNRLAATLLRQGRDIKLVPLYTPVRTDETDVSEHEVFYGGINVYLEQHSALFRALPRALSSLLDLPGLLNAVGTRAARIDPAEVGGLTVSVLQGPDGPQARELKHLIHGLKRMQVGLLNLPNLMFIGIAGALRAALNVPILCTLGGEDVFLDRLPQPYRQQAFDLIRSQADHADGYVALSGYYAGHCREHFHLPADKLRTVPLGMALDAEVRETEPPAPPETIAFVGRVCADKGFDRVVDALITLKKRGRDVRLLVAGYRGAGEEDFVNEQIGRLKQNHCPHEDRGEVSRADKFALLRAAHVFTMPSTFPEAKGMTILEAMSQGVPVVQPATGSFVETIEATGGGLLYDPDQPDALADALESLLDDPQRRRELGQAGRTAVARDYTDEVMADRMWQIYEDAATRFR